MAKKRINISMLCGVLAPLVYSGTVILGGILRPGYSHISQAISDLVAIGAPNKALLDSLFGIYNLMIIAFALGLFSLVRKEKQEAGKIRGAFGSVILLLVGVFGYITLLFPENPGPISQAASSGMMHILFAGLSSLSCMLAMLLLGLWFREIPHLLRYANYSFLSLVVVFVSGGLAAIGVATGSPIAGILERITIFGFLQWLLVVASVVYYSNSRRDDLDIHTFFPF